MVLARVFTWLCEGGICVASIAAEEDISAAQVKAEMLQQISLYLTRCVAKAAARRKPRVYVGAPPCARRCIAEAQLLQPGDDVAFEVKEN